MKGMTLRAAAAATLLLALAGCDLRYALIQAGVQCLAAPSGWNLLGRTPVRTYHPRREPVFLLEPGDAVAFYAVDASCWHELDQAATEGEPVAELVPA